MAPTEGRVAKPEPENIRRLYILCLNGGGAAAAVPQDNSSLNFLCSGGSC